ncbi:hypothetical protein [Hymenobacter rubripertinctus]|uniref:Uncharacterized protein n=1 Tax=Hymenobacter rubripertinctus TaxID=2029981 RepID=A0A418QRT8_9BACT|nr:hypothetical protein [Hymenobacter rubripertinctus]RIY07798.1 hypothetical protein D0T11_15595 [Hymenobacter rubripertinctus]
MYDSLRFTFAIGIFGLLLSTTHPLLAQTLPDSSAWRDTGPKTPHGLAVATTTAGKTVRAYFPVNSIGFEETVDYFARNPEVRPFPRIQHVDVDKLASVIIRGFYLENMRPAGCPKVLALRLTEGPVELFAFGGSAADKVPLLPSVLLPALALPTLMAQLGGLAVERNRWFLRRNGQLVAVTHGNFRKLMTEYTADCLAVSTQIAQGAEGFRYHDMPRVVGLYNDFLLNAGPR